MEVLKLDDDGLRSAPLTTTVFSFHFSIPRVRYFTLLLALKDNKSSLYVTTATYYEVEIRLVPFLVELQPVNLDI
ncbi:hypothetical protein PanWU01x14_152670 [Parasponia andersonii]|uniref:Uncharacterized protein n=1 Tax=Parasponia andersonii TaxID=3476 RepID=A0A2P5CHF3_PARAD|nr:hypothetical protein PanWU01x14_152670 [Parasponia andersonii]